MPKVIFVNNTLIIDNKKVTQISAGWYHLLFLVETGRVYSCGHNGNGQLGRVVASVSNSSTNLGLIPDLSNITQIAAGSNHSLFLNSSNQVYSCGYNYNGELGRVVATGSPTKTNLGVISSLSNIIQIFAGGYHSSFLNSSKQVYNCGYNNYGQLGRNVATGSPTSFNLGLISTLSDIIQIFGSYYHSLFLNSSNQVYSCGRNLYGALGRVVADGSASSSNLGVISTLSNITKIFAGNDFSSFLNSSNQVYNCGQNMAGNLGRVVADGSATSINLGLLSSLSNITQISTGNNYSLFLNSSNQVYSCGQNWYGELGRVVADGSNTSSNLGLISTLSNITRISSIIYKNLLFLNSSGQVYSCGQNSYSQLGRVVTDGSATSANLGMIPENSFS
jgi:alpha-tubulin suppressor-like RCC1 family protein